MTEPTESPIHHLITRSDELVRRSRQVIRRSEQLHADVMRLIKYEQHLNTELNELLAQAESPLHK